MRTPLYFSLSVLAGLIGWGVWRSESSKITVGAPPLQAAALNSQMSAGEVVSSSVTQANEPASGGGEPSQDKASTAEVSPEFRAWMARFRTASEAAKPDLLKEGMALAEARAGSMLGLMRKSPDEALEEALSWSDWAALPTEVRSRVEQPFSVTGDYEVRVDCRPLSERKAAPMALSSLVVGSEVLAIHRGKDWKEITSKRGLPAQGIRIGQEAVMRSGVVQVLDEADSAAVATLMPQREKFTSGSVTVLAGGERLTFADQATAARIAGELGSALAMNGAKTVQASLNVLYSASANQPGSLTDAALQASLASTTTPIKVLGVRMVFTDNSTNPYATAAAFTANLNAASARISAMSYGKTSLIVEVPGFPVALPNTAAYYTKKQDEMNLAARTALTSAGYNTNSYDVIVYSCPPVPGEGPNATLGGQSHNIYNNTTLSVLVHEFGHNYGLGHANFWVGTLAGGDFVERQGIKAEWGAAGNDEYGDSFDVMAVDTRQAPGSDPIVSHGDYAMSEKAYLNWITPSAVTTATTSGVYRVYRFDHSTAAADSSHKLGLKFTTAQGQTIWAGLRRNFTNNPLLSTGAYLVWGYRKDQHEQIDATPLSRIDAIPGNSYDIADLDREDSALPTGATWTSPDGSVKVTNLGTGGTAPQEYLDLDVRFIGVPAVGFDWSFYTDAAATIPGLTGSYFNGSPASAADWTTSAVRSGFRVDNPVNFTSPSWGSRSAVGLTGGTDALWDNFAVQWDGYLKVNPGTAVVLANRNDDGARFWLDLNGNNGFEATEEVKSNWGFIAGIATGAYSGTAQAGTYKIRVQYYDLDKATYPDETPPSFEFVAQSVGGRNFELYQNQSLSTSGLTSKYVNSSLRAVTSQADWQGTQTISGTRADPIPLYWDNTIGPRAAVGITGGTDGDWQNFSVQHEGWLKIYRRTRFLSYGADGTRFWIDANGDGSFGTSTSEFTTGNWGSNGAQRFGPFSGWVNPGTYKVRIQREQDADGGNRWAFMGQNDLDTNAGQGINLAGSGHITAPAGAGISGTFTVEAWARPANTNVLTIVSTRNDFGFDMKLMNGNLVHADIGTASAWLNTSADAPYNYRVGEWYHVAYCVGGGSYEVYVNGWKAGTGTYTGTPLLCDATHPFKIGSYNGTAENFSGDIDEVRVWTTKRTGEQIAANYRRIISPTAAGLASCWRLDETSGTVVADITGARHGSYSGTVNKVSLASPVSGATSLAVTTNAESGPGSLHDTIALANALATPAVITITATGAIRHPNSVIQFTPISGQLTINGPGASSLMLTGFGRVFQVTSGGSLTLRGVTLAGEGIGAGGDGSGAGAALVNRGGSVVMEDCVVRDCVGSFDFGGACFSNGPFTARRCRFSGNKVFGGDGADRGAGTSGGGGGGGAGMGGAIFCQTGPLLLEDCVFTGNQANGGRGGIGGENESSLFGGSGGKPNFGVGGATAGANGSAGGYGGGGGGGAGNSFSPYGNGGAGGTGGGGGGGGASFGGGTGGSGGAGNVGGGAGGTAQFSFAGGGGGGGGLGGAIFVRSGSATLTRCTLSGNSGTGGLGGTGSFGNGNGQNGQSFGGAIYSEGTLVLQSCTLEANTSSAGGGAIYAPAGTVSVTQSTLANNQCTGNRGGAIATRCPLTLTHCTVVGNTALNDSGGVRHDSGVFNLAYSIVAGNTVGGLVNDVYIGTAILTRTGTNLVQNLLLDGLAVVNGTGTTNNAAPVLAPLSDYGSPHRTILPLPGSPALNAATGSTITTDQRGLPMNGTPDLGAVESQPALSGVTDTDNDGMDDRLEPLYGFTVGINDGNLDADGDGSSNKDELGNKTGPRDPNSLLKILSFTKNGNNVTFTHTSFPGLTYTFDYGSTLPLTGSVGLGTATGMTNGNTVGPLPADRAFFRIRRN